MKHLVNKNSEYHTHNGRNFTPWKRIRKVQQHESFTFKSVGGGGGVECKVESRSLKLFIPDNTLSYVNLLPNTKESKNSLPLQFVKLVT